MNISFESIFLGKTADMNLLIKYTILIKNRNCEVSMAPYISQVIHEKSPYDDERYFGKINQHCYFAKVEGECGDDMSFYLIIENQTIKQIKYFTQDGCDHTKLAGLTLAQMAKGLHIDQALDLSCAALLRKAPVLEQSAKHCSVLAMTAFYNAISHYLLS